VVQAVMTPHAPEELLVMVSDHPKWPLRREIQIAVLRSAKTPETKVRQFAKNFSEEVLREILPESRRETLMPTLESSKKCSSSTTEETNTEETKTGDSE